MYFLSLTFTIYMTAGEGNCYFLTPLYQFYPVHKRLGISHRITTDNSPNWPRESNLKPLSHCELSTWILWKTTRNICKFWNPIWNFNSKVTFWTRIMLETCNVCKCTHTLTHTHTHTHNIYIPFIYSDAYTFFAKKEDFFGKMIILLESITQELC